MSKPLLSPTCIGVLLAAGRGRRLGGAKPLISWPTADGPKPLVAAAYDAIRPACTEMVVVLGHAPERVATALAGRPFRAVTSDPDAELFESIRRGLQEAQSVDAAACVLLQPGDHPEVSPATLAVIWDAHVRAPDVAILPEHQGRGGHPVLIPPQLACRLIKEACPNGLAQFWRDHPELCQRIALDDAGVVRDIDTPADLPMDAG